jgi:hypothetical protein
VSVGGIRSRRIPAVTATAAVLAALSLTACGSGTQQNPNEPHGYFPVKVSSSFPRSQQLAERSRFVVKVTNSGHKTIPDVAVSILNPKAGPGAQAFGYMLPEPASNQPPLASRSRPVWLVMQNPGPCRYSCRNLGPGGAATAYTNTWALGKLKPGATATFQWRLEAVKPGTWQVQYQVAAGLNGYAKAELSGSGGHQRPHGTYTVRISTIVPRTHVKPDGQVVVSDTEFTGHHHRH